MTKKHYDDGGIVVTAPRGGMSGINPSQFDLSKMRSSRAADDMKGGITTSRGPAGKPITGPKLTFGGINPPQLPSAVQQAGSGAPGPRMQPGVGARLGFRFAEGGKAKVKKVKKMAKGGSASSRADGIARKGKTRGKVC